MSRLGYTQAVDWLRPDSSAALSEFRKVRWRGQNYRLLRIYDEDATKLRGFAPDRRTFLFETATGERRSIKGYRGDSKPLSRRALPVYDARLLVNLVCTSPGSKFLDPFAGIGGVVIEAVASGYAVTSADNDCALRFGLANLGVYFHAVADAQLLPFSDQTFDAIATEPPYDRQAASAVVNSLREMRRVLTTGGRMAMLCAAWQSEPLRRAADGIGLLPYVDTPVNRKGVDVAVLAWLKP